jgi:hypothetical protein
MTADFYPYDMSFLARTATRIINEATSAGRVGKLGGQATPLVWRAQGSSARAPSAFDLQRDRGERRQRQRERSGKSMAGQRRRCDASHIAHA